MWPCGYRLGCREKRKQVARRTHRRGSAAVGEEAVADDFRLLLEPVTLERPAVLELIGVAAERMAHQRQIEAPSLLRLPHMGHFMDEQALPVKRLFREVVGPQIGMRMEMNIA